jgi:hypothetical protein
MADLCRVVRYAIQARLSDAAMGFNAKYAAIQDSYQTPDIAIDWSADSINFGWGPVPIDLIEETSPLRYPLLAIMADRGQQDPPQQRIKYKQFSGKIQANVWVHLSWEDEQVTDFETWPEAVIDAMYSSINDPTLPNKWGTGVLYNGDLNFVKGPIVMAGRNWRRTIAFPSTFTVIL